MEPIASEKLHQEVHTAKVQGPPEERSNKAEGRICVGEKRKLGWTKQPTALRTAQAYSALRRKLHPPVGMPWFFPKRQEQHLAETTLYIQATLGLVTWQCDLI